MLKISINYFKMSKKYGFISQNVKMLHTDWILNDIAIHVLQQDAKI
jgi:hypothetical protein